MNQTPTLGAVGIFYLVFVTAMVYFVIKPSLRAGTRKRARMHGALFGLVAYATYDLTNLATPRDGPRRWPP